MLLLLLNLIIQYLIVARLFVLFLFWLFVVVVLCRFAHDWLLAIIIKWTVYTIWPHCSFLIILVCGYLLLFRCTCSVRPVLLLLFPRYAAGTPLPHFIPDDYCYAGGLLCNTSWHTRRWWKTFYHVYLPTTQLLSPISLVFQCMCVFLRFVLCSTLGCAGCWWSDIARTLSSACLVPAVQCSGFHGCAAWVRWSLDDSSLWQPPCIHTFIAVTQNDSCLLCILKWRKATPVLFSWRRGSLPLIRVWYVAVLTHHDISDVGSFPVHSIPYPLFSYSSVHFTTYLHAGTLPSLPAFRLLVPSGAAWVVGGDVRQHSLVCSLLASTSCGFGFVIDPTTSHWRLFRAFPSLAPIPHDLFILLSSLFCLIWAGALPVVIGRLWCGCCC
jgi:hypothetical protein